MAAAAGFIPMLLGGAGTMLGGLLGKSSSKPLAPAAQPKTALTPPVTETPKVAPTPDDLTVKRKKQRAVSRKYGTGGRTGTMLTDSDDSSLG